ncbi:hypothetical protein ACG98H_03445 [Corynebacterium sp. L4756]|uniref:hypothetical protein n=1 Tax=unclassified Corynebacterium TaxID=2624378 RepID=UPI00374CB0B8
MGKKKDDGLESRESMAEQLQPLIDDDAFLTELSLGNDPSDGEDELAALFLELREDVERQMPAAPLIEGAELEPEVISLADARKRRRKGRPILNGLIGAAAATVLIAGSGAAIYNSGPGSPLYGVNQTMFDSDDSAFVELAGTLEEMDAAAASGDMDSTRELLEEARGLAAQARGDRRVAESEANEASRANRTTPRTTTVTETVEAETPQQTEQPAPETTTTTVVEQQTETVVETTTVYDNTVPNPLPEPTNNPEPTEDPTNPGGNQGGNGGGELAPPQVQN